MLCLHLPSLSHYPNSRDKSKEATDEDLLLSLWKDIGIVKDKMPLLPAIGDELATHHPHHCFRDDGHLLLAEDLLVTT